MESRTIQNADGPGVERVRAAGRWPWAEMFWSGAAVMVAAGACYVWIDRRVAEGAHRLSREWHLAGSRGSEVGEALYWLIGLAAVAAALWWRGRRAAAWRWIEVWVAVAASGLLVNAIKVIVSRARPSVLFPTDKFPGDLWGFFFSQRWDSHFQGFPSGHATTAGAVAAAICIARPRWAWAGVFYGVVAASRILAEAHFVSDVLVGGYLGVVTMMLVRAAGRRKTPD